MNYLLNFKSFFTFLKRNKAFTAINMFCLLVAFVTVFFQSYQAANENPVKNVKAE